MALVACHECGEPVSTQARACPKCGAAPRVAKKGGALLIAGLFGLFLVGVVAVNSSKSPELARPTVKTEAETKRDAQLTNAATHAVLLKQSMKDPQSFDLLSLIVQADGAACFEYRSKNGFGAYMKGQAVLSRDGALLTRERDRNKFVKAWNSACLTPGGQELAPLMKERGIG